MKIYVYTLRKMTDEIYRQIGLNIKKYRILRGITQEMLADKINKSVNHVGKIEVAFSQPSLQLLIDIANVLDVPLKNLFEFDS